MTRILMLATQPGAAAQKDTAFALLYAYILFEVKMALLARFPAV
jgi:hypothetical protein